MNYLKNYWKEEKEEEDHLRRIGGDTYRRSELAQQLFDVESRKNIPLIAASLIDWGSYIILDAARTWGTYTISFTATRWGIHYSATDVCDALYRASKEIIMLRTKIDDKNCFVADAKHNVPVLSHSVDSTEDARAVARKLVDKGVEKDKYLFSFHLIGDNHLLVIGDHVATDGRGIFALIQMIMSMLNADPIVQSEENTNFINFFDQISIPDTYPDYTIDNVTTIPAHHKPSQELVKDVPVIVDKDLFQKVKEYARKHNQNFSALLLSLLSFSFSRVVERQGVPHPHNIVSHVAVDLRLHCEPKLPPTLVSSVSGSANVSVTIDNDTELEPMVSDAGAQIATLISSKEMLRLFHVLKTKPQEAAKFFNLSIIFSNVGHFPYPTECDKFSIESMSFLISGPGGAPFPSVHLVEVNGHLELTFTYSPQCFGPDVFRSVGDEFIKILDNL
ncbi:hypothetical protein GEMRC1_002649 [Eukaryota sp. GEM-RC1]